MTELQYSPASIRNSGPLVDVLRHEFASTRNVLEVGSGTGQHAVLIAETMPHLTWQTSDLAGNHAQIRAHIAHAALDNVLSPIEVDTRRRPVPMREYDAVFSCNTAHIMSWDAVQGMFTYASEALGSAGILACYGPFSRGGTFNTESNRAFDQSLRMRDPHMGIRDLFEVDGLANAVGMTLVRMYAMPANNLFVVWQKFEEQLR